jgi:hypothetical protein
MGVYRAGAESVIYENLLSTSLWEVAVRSCGGCEDQTIHSKVVQKLTHLSRPYSPGPALHSLRLVALIYSSLNVQHEKPLPFSYSSELHPSSRLAPDRDSPCEKQLFPRHCPQDYAQNHMDRTNFHSLHPSMANAAWYEHRASRGGRRLHKRPRESLNTTLAYNLQG